MSALIGCAYRDGERGGFVKAEEEEKAGSNDGVRSTYRRFATAFVMQSLEKYLVTWKIEYFGDAVFL